MSKNLTVCYKQYYELDQQIQNAQNPDKALEDERAKLIDWIEKLRKIAQLQAELKKA